MIKLFTSLFSIITIFMVIWYLRDFADRFNFYTNPLNWIWIGVLLISTFIIYVINFKDI